MFANEVSYKNPSKAFEVSFYHTNEYGNNESNMYNEPARMVRRYINPAVYIETDVNVCDTPAYSRSFHQLHASKPNSNEDIPKYLKVKTCTCSETSQDKCPSHCNSDSSIYLDGVHSQNTSSTHLPIRPRSTPKMVTKPLIAHYPYTRSASDITTVKKCEPSIEVKPTISASSTTTITSIERRKSDDEAFKKWLAEKNRQKKMQQEEKARLEEQKKRERERVYIAERESFMKWLAAKKKQNIKERRFKEKCQSSEEILKKAEEEKKKLENELKYRLWLKKKEEVDLEKKLSKQIELLKIEEEKKKKQELNEEAFKKWLEKSGRKPKPLPLNRGLESLRASVSVSYVNPHPWVPPDIDCYSYSN